MLRKRIIFTLIYSDDFFMQSRNFRLQKVGDLNWLEKNYKFASIATAIDELIILNATKSNKSINAFANTISKVVKNVFIPIAAGGGVKNMNEAELLFNSGADKIVLNSSLIENPVFVKELIKNYGSQSIIASVDYRKINDKLYVFINDGSVKIELTLIDYIKYLENLGVGEVYLNSIENDGTGFGYDLETANTIINNVRIPIIIAGGAGNENHFRDALLINNVYAVATANLFNFIGDGLINAREYLINNGENIVNWKKNKL
jgi:cyclase